MLICPHGSRKPRVNDTLIYKLRVDQNPADPEKKWHGIIQHILIDIDD